MLSCLGNILKSSGGGGPAGSVAMKKKKPAKEGDRKRSALEEIREVGDGRSQYCINLAQL